MPAIIAKSISILSDAGLGMAMFSLGQFTPLLVILQNIFSQKQKKLVIIL